MLFAEVSTVVTCSSASLGFQLTVSIVHFKIPGDSLAAYIIRLGSRSGTRFADLVGLSLFNAILVVEVRVEEARQILLSQECFLEKAHVLRGRVEDLFDNLFEGVHCFSSMRLTWNVKGLEKVFKFF